MTPLEEGSRPDSPAAAQAWLAAHGPACWQRADGAALAAACAAVPDDALAHWPAVARWRALAALLDDSAEALPCLELAHAGHLAAGDAAAALLDAHIALALCLVDIGAMEGVNAWVQRSQPAPDHAPAAAPADGFAALWLALGEAARAVLSPEHGQGAGLALARLHRHLAPLGPGLPPHERLLVAQVLVNAHFARQQFEQFDRLQAAVEAPAAFAAAPPLMRARWHHTLGFACYQVGRWDVAEAAWQQALVLASAHGLAHQGLMASLAMLRLLLDRQRLADAAAVEAAIDPRWGAGRPMQLMWLQQMRARLALLRGQPARAQAVLAEALALADQAGLSPGERGALHSDQVQVLLALGHEADALALLASCAQASGAPAAAGEAVTGSRPGPGSSPGSGSGSGSGSGPHPGSSAAASTGPGPAPAPAPAPAPSRDAAVFQCLHGLLRAQAQQWEDEAAARLALQAALRQAQALRYTMFFRLLPARAAAVCALALRWGIEPAFAAEVVRERQLPAPPGAGPAWPWLLWLRLLGGFELRLQGQALPRQAKPQAKPLELLRYLACTPGLCAPMRQIADALWPASDGAAAHKSLEMTVQRSRRLLGDDSLLQVHDGVLGLDSLRSSSDLQQRGQASRALQALAMKPGADAHADLRQAQALLQALQASAPDASALLLPGAPDAPWLLARRQEATADLQRAARAGQAVLARVRAPGRGRDGDPVTAAGAPADSGAGQGGDIAGPVDQTDLDAFILGLQALRGDPS